MKLIPLTQRQFAIVNDSDFNSVNRWKWQATRHPKTGKFYATRQAERDEEGHRDFVALGRFLLGLKEGDHRLVNYRNGNTST